jgi:probable HAF family extracellular repeat protein
MEVRLVRPATLCSLALAGACLGATAASALSMLVDFGDADVVSVAAVSADGTVVVGSRLTASGREAFRWTPRGGMVGLGDLPGGTFESGATAVSADGSVIVGSSRSASGFEAFRWTQSGGMVALGDLDGGTFQSSATDVSADGTVVVGSGVSAAGSEGFRWTASGGLVELGDLPGGESSSAASAVSADGAVVVGHGESASSTPNSEAFRFTAGEGMIGLGDLAGGSFLSGANDASADGSVIVGFAQAGVTDPIMLHPDKAFRWTAAEGLVPLGNLPGGISSGAADVSSAEAVSADGSIIVGSSIRFTGGPVHEERSVAFVWDPVNGMRPLYSVLESEYGIDLSQWQGLDSAFGISADGRTIVGRGTRGSSVAGVSVYWVAFLPEPRGLVPLALGAVLLASRWPLRSRR